MQIKDNVPQAEFKKYSLENWGQLLKVSTSLPPDVFPYRVGIPLESPFFQSLRERVFRGKATLGRSTKTDHPASSPHGTMIERIALMAANDLGEIMVSREVFDGNFFLAGSDAFDNYTHLLRRIPLPPGWRSFGGVHSHPTFDEVNFLMLLPFRSVPRVGHVPVTFSGGDARSLLHSTLDEAMRLSTLGMINSAQVSFMVATARTLAQLAKPDSEVKRILESKSEMPPFDKFEKLGVVLYAGNHFGRRSGEVQLERLK